MRSFSLLTLAAAALAPFVSAAPLVNVDAVAAAKADVHARLVDVDAAAKADIHARLSKSNPNSFHGYAREMKGCAEILIDLKVNLGVPIDTLNCLTPANATAKNITPVLKDIISVIGDAVVDLKVLVGADVSVILASVDGTAQVAVSVIAQLLADVLCLVIGALVVVLSVVADVSILLDAVVSVALGGCLCELVSAVIAIVDGLLVELVPLVVLLAGDIVSLGLTVVGSLLAIC